MILQVNGYYIPGENINNRIVFNIDAVGNYSDAELAILLAHEATHALWDHGGAPPTHEHYSIDEEYNAFKNQSEIWEELRPGEGTNLSYDDWVTLMAMGEYYAKEEIRKLYPDLPEY